MLKAFAVAFLITAVYSCQKGLKGPNGDAGNAINLSSESVQIGEPLAASVSEYSGDVSWSVSPAQNADIDADGNESTVTFFRSGNYMLSALTSNGVISRNITVGNVFRATADSSGGDTTGGGDTSYIASLLGDQIRMRPLSDSGGLAFFSITTNKYPCRNNYLVYTQNLDTGTNINYVGVQIPANCFGGTARSRAYIVNRNYNQPGYYPITITLNGLSYRGTLQVTNTEYIFNWPYTTGVVISPKRITR